MITVYIQISQVEELLHRGIDAGLTQHQLSLVRYRRFKCFLRICGLGHAYNPKADNVLFCFFNKLLFILENSQVHLVFIVTPVNVIDSRWQIIKSLT